jgi:uncharacterized protein YndB with AHSA1/START domain
MKWLKKTLKTLLLLIVVGFLGLYLYGFRPSAGKNSATIEINRPAAQIWRHLADDELVKKWVGGLEVIRHLNPETQGAGARTYMEERYEGDLAKMEMTIIVYDPPRHVSFSIEGVGDPSMGFSEGGDYVLVEQNGHTTLTLTASSIYHGFKPRLFEPFITPMAQKKLEEDLARLKSLVEAEPVMNP